MERIKRHALPVLVVAVVLVAGACGGGGGDGGDGVASLAGASGESAAAATADDDTPSEEEILAWVECMREEGLDVPDPTVDDDGNLVLGGGPRPGGAGPANGTAGAGNDTDAQPIDREAFQAAFETCGQPPRAGGGFSEEDQQERQDAALAFAQCLRDEGIDAADPDFSAMGPGGPPPSDDADDSSAQPTVRRGPFGDIDMDDPDVQAAFDACRGELGDSFPGPGGAGGPGGGPQGQTATAGDDSASS